jgi:NADH-quinone oxidoreductase subunit H
LADFARSRLPQPWGDFAVLLLGVGAMVGFVSLNTMFLIWLERKVCARFQARLGPTRVGFHGLLQPVADAIKLLLKEGIRPRASDLWAYYLAPLLPLISSFLVLAVLPLGPGLQVVDLDAGVVYVAAVSGLGILGVLVGGWSSNSKYSLLGAMRSGAQLFSYELSLILCLLLVVMASGTGSLKGVVEAQQGGIWDWWILKLPVVGALSFLLFLISSTAELNRGPLDLSEAESELTGGFHTEYTGIAFSLFFLAEYINLFVASVLGALLFLGGYWAPQFGIPGLDPALAAIPGTFWLLFKAYGLIFVYMWFRWTFPRLRIDHLLALEWKYLLPVSLANLLLGATLLALGWVLP